MSARSEIAYRAGSPRLTTRCPLCKGSLIQRIPKPSYGTSVAFHCLFCKHVWKVHLDDPYTNAAGTVRGEVFVVTRRKVKHKLGSVEVIAVAGESLRKHLKSRTLQRTLESEKLERDIDAVAAALEIAQADDDRLWQILKRDENNPEKAEAWSGAYEKAKSLAQRVDDLESQRRRLASEEYFFEDLPPAAATATTDADGKFTLAISRTEQFGLIARGSRQLLKGIETYSWLVWVNLDGEAEKRLVLSNANLIRAAARR